MRRVRIWVAAALRLDGERSARCEPRRPKLTAYSLHRVPVEAIGPQLRSQLGEHNVVRPGRLERAINESVQTAQDPTNRHCCYH